MDPWNIAQDHAHQLAELNRIRAVLQWDEQVMMPPKGASSRGPLLAKIARDHHATMTSPALGDALAALLEAELPSPRARAVALLHKARERAVRVDADLVGARSEAQSEAFHTWAAAKEADDVQVFAPKLAHVFSLEREVAAAIDPTADPYDVLMEAYEPGMTSAELRTLFRRIEHGLRPLIDATRDLPTPPPFDAIVPIARQRPLHDAVIAAMGYDLTAGRLDFAEHPFSITLSPGDVRITTHLYDDDVLRGLSGTIHETGHALYEQGMPHRLPGTGVDEAASLGLHESQSRLWENFIGRSRPFLRWLADGMRTHLGLTVEPDELYRIANPIRPSTIRVFADEVTYNLHIAVRFELETALLAGDLAVDDLPGAWNEAYQRVLGITPATDREGCLQDVHWGAGAIGYFPTYTIGNVFAASIGRALEEALPDLWQQVERGELAPVLAWLREHIHQHGHDRPAAEIVRNATGARDGVEDLIAHVWARHGALYGVQRPT